LNKLCSLMLQLKLLVNFLGIKKLKKREML